MAARIRIDVVTTFEGGDHLDVTCFFSRLNPIPLAAHQDFLAAIAAIGEGDGLAQSAAYTAAVCSLFDAACVEARCGDDPVPLPDVPHMVKSAAMEKVIASWTARVKAPGQPSAATS